MKEAIENNRQFFLKSYPVPWFRSFSFNQPRFQIVDNKFLYIHAFVLHSPILYDGFSTPVLKSQRLSDEKDVGEKMPSIM